MIAEYQYKGIKKDSRDNVDNTVILYEDRIQTTQIGTTVFKSEVLEREWIQKEHITTQIRFKGELSITELIDGRYVIKDDKGGIVLKAPEDVARAIMGEINSR